MSLGMRALQQYAQFKSRGEIEIRIFFNTLGGSLQVTEQVTVSYTHLTLPTNREV